MAHATYLIAIGSNRRTGKHGSPRAAVAAAIAKLKGRGSRIIATRAIGPGGRDFANAVAVIKSKRTPPHMLKRLKKLERKAGRRAGQRWGARALDLDIIGWSGGIWASRSLTIPHPQFRSRRFVLAPLVEIAPDWRDPVTHLTPRHLLHRLDRRRPRP